MRIVFDTNIIISALMTHGLSYRILDICIDKHRLFISDWIINEVIDKFNNKFKIKKNEVERIKNFIDRAFINIKPKGKIPDICRDVDDNNVLLLADFIKADIIITGDKDLLDLNEFNNILIIKPREFIEKYEN